MEEQLRHGSAAFSNAGNNEDAEIERRRAALSAFLRNPEVAATAFPDLIEDLLMFVLCSTNPYANAYDDGVAVEGKDQSFDEWIRAVEWAERHRP